MDRIALGAEPWRPLLAENRAAEAQDMLASIATTLAQPEVFEGLPLGLHRGWVGLALFFGHLHLARPGEGWGDLSQTLLGRAVEDMAEQELVIRFMDGFPGIAWGVDHLQADVFGGAEDFNASIDETLLAFLDHRPKPTVFDLSGGLCGIGVYALGRRGLGQGRRLAARVVQCLKEDARDTSQGLTWHSAPAFIPGWQRELHPDGHFDLGVAHGVPGVIAFLARACAADIEADLALSMLERAVDWLLAQAHPGEDTPRFPRTRDMEGAADPVRNGLGWCYGDLSLSIALLGAARRVGRPDWEAEALALSRAAARRKPADTLMPTPGLCHGVAGTCHMFNRLHQATGEETFQTAALQWFDELRRRWSPSGFPGLESVEYPDVPAWYCDAGLIVGIAGIGLSLLAATEAQSPTWDRLFFLDLPRGT